MDANLSEWLRKHGLDQCRCGSAFEPREPCALVGVRHQQPALVSKNFTLVVPLICRTCGEVRFVSPDIVGIETP